MDTMIPEGLRIHMNCVKPHMALDGRSPAQKPRHNEREGKMDGSARIGYTRLQ